MLNYKLNNQQVKKICKKIERERILPFLPFVNENLEKLGFTVDKHSPFFYTENVIIGNQGMNGFLMVNMDGFHSNCVNDDELTTIFSFDSVLNIKIKSGENSCMIALKSSDGILTIEESDGISLQIIYTIYHKVWADIIEEFRNEPIILWNTVDKMNIKRISFNSIDEINEYCDE